MLNLNLFKSLNLIHAIKSGLNKVHVHDCMYVCCVVCVCVWYSAGSDARVLVGHAGPVYCTTINADNSFLASGSEDGTGT